MKNIILFILFLVGIFILNIAFYYSSESYRDFLKRVKTESSKEVNIEEEFIKNEELWSYFSWKIEEKEIKEVEKEKIEEKQEIKEEVKLGAWYQNILKLFSEYDLSMLPVSKNLFDLTNEYPEPYYEYYSSKLTLYFFTSKTYNQVYDIFSVLQGELPFKVNQANNFWEKSFYINFNNDINDNVIRMVISHNWIVFWLKVDKKEYENIKQKLQNLRNN